MNSRALLLGRLTFKQYTALTVLTMPDGSKVWGLDLSHWNRPPVALKRMVELYGLSFVIIKGCDGSLNTNYYLEHVAAAKEAGIPWGMYVWVYPGSKVSIDTQVNAWRARAEADPPPMGIFLDLEWTYYAGQPANPNATDARTAHDKWKAKSGKSATTYTAKGYADTYLIGFDWTREELWVANYGVSIPALPTGASDYTIHQFTSTLDGKLLDPDGNFELDGNYYHNAELFKARFGGITPPIGEPMRYRVVGANGLNLRTAPVSGSIIILVPPNTYVFGVIDPVSEWLHGTSYQQPGLSETPLDFWCSALPGYIVEDAAPVNDVVFESFDLHYRLNGVPYIQPFKPDGLPRKV